MDSTCSAHLAGFCPARGSPLAGVMAETGVSGTAPPRAG